MEFEKQPIVRQMIDDVLTSDDDPIAKVQALVDLGVEEESANDIVERYQIGQNAVVYYEQLPLSLSKKDL